MRKSPGASWERYGRRFVLRLSLKHSDEKEILDEFDRRSSLLERDDKDFLRNCLVVGFKVLYKEGFNRNSVALSSNESNNTQKQHHEIDNALKNNESNALHGENSKKPSGAKALLGGLMKHE